MSYKYLFILFIISCNPKMSITEEAYNKEYSGRTVILSDSLQLINGDKTINIENNSHNVYVILDGSCSSCIESILGWNNMYNNIHKINPLVNIIIVVTANNVEKTIEFFDILKFEHPYYIDTKSIFLNNDNLSSVLNFSNIISDKRNKVVLIGNILSSKPIRNKFLEIISNNNGNVAKNRIN